MSDAQYPYRVPFKRTASWWASNGLGDWATISTWCNDTFGDDAWNYYGGDFVFEHERDYMLFILKWQVQRLEH